MRTFWLSFHSSYACRDSGACCASGWEIPIETGRVAPVRRAIDTGTIAVPAGWLRPVDGAPADVAGTLALGSAGRCVFHRDPGCAIQTALGHDAMPASCQHFPRVCLIDSRGVFVTLSHYCPTAAALLFESPGPVSIEEGPPAVRGLAVPEGLDARKALPPSRSPRMLMDLAEFAEWEQEMVTVLSTIHPVEQGLEMLENRARAIARLSSNVIKGAGPVELFAIARAAVPAPHSWPAAPPRSDDEWNHIEPAWHTLAPVIGRFLAAHAFASWMAYQGNGVRSTVLSLRQALAVLRIETIRRCRDFQTPLNAVVLTDAIRHTDLLLRHLVDRQRLASRLSALAEPRT